MSSAIDYRDVGQALNSIDRIKFVHMHSTKMFNQLQH